MLGAAEAGELRALQARAYGRAGVLTDADAERLRQLEDARAPRLAETDAVSTAVETDLRSHRESAAATLRTHWRAASVVLVSLLLVGLALGWLLFADHGPAGMSLTAEQQEWHDAIIASGDFDPGSVRAVQEEKGVVIWFASKKDGEQVCLVLGDGETTAPACTTREQAMIQGVTASLMTVVGDGQNHDIDAQLFLTRDGEPAVVARSYLTAPPSGVGFASPEEAALSVSLAEQTGLDRRSVMVVGYDGDVPIWFGVDKETQRYCLVFDGSTPEPAMTCDDGLMLADADRSLLLEVANDGATTRYEYRLGYGQQYLTVTKGLGGDDAAGE